MSPHAAVDHSTKGTVWLPLAFVSIVVVSGVPSVGWPVVLVIGTGDVMALAFWLTKGRFHLAGRQMLPFHLATMACLHVHVYEELTQDFASAMRQTFHMATFSDATFLGGIVNQGGGGREGTKVRRLASRGAPRLLGLVRAAWRYSRRARASRSRSRTPRRKTWLVS